ncbi:peptidoglycan-binding protein [Streptomyces pristinaespiralis]|uniref:Peptidoglycan binding-like domain-containing protein n=2 Tax=Streptomyces pristinaespiralis TaxID=38300 RepID=B5H851_STRE2|nr:peptidoglycan-binding domain-containing protein [Streptomyces pristinaespiralis]ALC18999.1 hypothetical protein SPRI_0693 [Streptomyces pristinaespiralis]EDY63042.1 conserved hypothetical protein [Streptomyces pristinaespiralis ATCC 25486]QMU17892.1 peptidoglycan-binding protein [Streptomyces pristinaespiralis]
MIFRTTRGRLAGALIAACATGAMALSSSPASAKVSDGYIRGYDMVEGDWSDEGVISAGEYSSSTATCMWQRILRAHGAPKPSGLLFSESDIDGHFGPNTTHATKWLQWKFGLVDSPSKADGRVGPNTFRAAQKYLVRTGGITTPGSTVYFRYEGWRYGTNMSRNGQGIYVFQDGTDHARQANYDSNECD